MVLWNEYSSEIKRCKREIQTLRNQLKDDKQIKELEIELNYKKRCYSFVQTANGEKIDYSGEVWALEGMIEYYKNRYIKQIDRKQRDIKSIIGILQFIKKWRSL